MNQIEQDIFWMGQALQQAEEARLAQEVPVGAVLVKNNAVLAVGRNSSIESNDPTAHAEIVALRHAGVRERNYRIVETTMYVTLEPCLMCVGALLHARVQRLVFATKDPKTGACGSMFDILSMPVHNHEIVCHSGVLAGPCSQILRDFFRERRQK
jgi:tRNA(adenine34) deaminase